MRKEDYELIHVGDRVKIGSRLLGSEMGYGDDPVEYKKYLDKVGVVKRVTENDGRPMVEVVFGHAGSMPGNFFIEEIEYIVSDEDEKMDIEESEESLDALFKM